MAWRTHAPWAVTALALALAGYWGREVRTCRNDLAALRAECQRLAARPKLRLPPPKRPPQRSARPLPAQEARIAPKGRLAPAPSPEGERIDESRVDAAVKARIAAMKKARLEARERRREAIASLTDEQKAAQREAFVTKMRERSDRRLKAFVSKTGLDSDQTKSFENTVAALDTSLREAAEQWAEQIRTSGSFSQDARVKFIGDMSTIISSGYGQMDETLPSTWRTDDGNVNLMEIVGPEAFASVVEALTENGLEDGLQTIGQVMGGPQSEGGEGPGGEGPGGEGPGGEGGIPGDMAGIESPGVGEGPGGAGLMGGGAGMGGAGSAGAGPAGANGGAGMTAPGGQAVGGALPAAPR